MANKTDIFDENYIRQITDKWLTNIVIPQVYDDSLSYYEEINKILGCLSDISKAVDEYRAKVSQEIIDRINAIAKEEAERKQADTTLQSNIDNEAQARTEADNTLNTNLNKEIQDRTNADTTLQANIDAEKSARENADNTLQGNINAEKSARESEDNTLQGNIDAEKSARESADNTLTTSLKSKLKWQWTSTTAFIESLTISDENNI